MFFRICPHDSTPTEKAEDGNDDVEGIEARLEGQFLIGVEPAGNHIDGYPDEPLLQILMSKGPDAQKTEGGGKRVGHGYRGVGEGNEHPPDQCPQGTGAKEPGKDETTGEMGNSEW